MRSTKTADTLKTGQTPLKKKAIGKKRLHLKAKSGSRNPKCVCPYRCSHKTSTDVPSVIISSVVNNGIAVKLEAEGHEIYDLFIS